VSFDIHLHTCRLGKRVRKTVNPFTNEPILVPIDRGLSASERKAVSNLLAQVNAIGPDPDGYYNLTFSDGGMADACIGSLEGKPPCIAFGIEVQVMTDELVSFLYKLAQSGNMSIMPIMQDAVPLLTSLATDQLVQERWPDALVIDSPAQLERLLRKGYKQWTRYRDQVVKEIPNKPAPPRRHNTRKRYDR
jgi:hypothetical protein